MKKTVWTVIIGGLFFELIFVGKIPGFGFGSHWYLGSQTFDVWQNFDPEFYDSLTSQSGYGVFTRKFYYIGLFLPDLFDSSNQVQIQSLISFLHDELPLDTVVTIQHTISADLLFFWIRIPVEITAEVYMDSSCGLFIHENTYNQVKESMHFNGSPPNTNPEKLYEMVQYARSQGWSPLEKAMIYGAYMHVVQDIYAHMVFQPAAFGYPYAVESDSVVNKEFLYFPELYYELFTDTYVPDWGFLADLYHDATFGGPPWWRHYVPYSFYGMLGRDGWQNNDFTAVEKFIEAAQGVGYAGAGLTQERLESYIHGWAILHYMTYGHYSADDSWGGILAHVNWNAEDILKFVGSSMLDYYQVDILDIQGDAGHLGDNLTDVVADFLLSSGFLNMIVDPTNYMRNYLLHNPMLFLQRIGHLANGSTLWYREWPYFLEGVEGLDEAVGGIGGWNNDSLVTEDLRELRRELGYWELYAQYPPPCRREYYEGDLEKALGFANEFKKCVEQGPDYLDYTPWTVSRKSGVLGGMWEIDPSGDYYDQPGVFNLNFYKNGSVSYTTQTIPLEGPATTINLNYDLVTFGGTKVLVLKESDTLHPLASTQLEGPDRKTGSLSFNAQDAVNEGADTVFFEVQTKQRNGQSYTIMFKSDYREPYNTHPEIHENPYYQTYFVNGNPVRTQSQNPITDPAHYWPYVLPLKDTLTALNNPTNLSASSSAPWTSVTLTWQDNSNYETGYVIEREERNGGWLVLDTLPSDSTSFIDHNLQPFNYYQYRLKAIAPGVSSDAISVITFTGPKVSNPSATAFNNSPKISFSNNKVHIVFADTDNIYYSQADQFGSNWTAPIALSLDPFPDTKPLIVSNNSSLASLWIKPEVGPNDPFDRIVVTYSNDNGNTWSQPTQLLTGAIDDQRKNCFLNLSAIYLGDEGIYVALMVYYDHNIRDSQVPGDHIWIGLFPLNQGQQIVDQIDTLYDFEITTENIPTVTGPTIGVKDGELIVVWSINGQLMFRTVSREGMMEAEADYYGVIGEGINPSLAADQLVYEWEGNIYYSTYVGASQIDYWSNPLFVAQGNYPSITKYGDRVYVFHQSDGEVNVTYGPIGLEEKETMSIVDGENSYVSGVVWDVSILGDTAVPVRLGHNGGEHMYIGNAVRRYGYVVCTGDVYGGEIVFRHITLPHPLFGGGPQESSGVSALRVYGVRPNPFSDMAMLGMYLSRRSDVKLKVYDVAGRLVMRREYKKVGPGRLEIPLRGSELGSGVYFYRLNIGEKLYGGRFSVLR